jgi:tetratricopeptide (TPR) repeat protein
VVPWQYQCSPFHVNSDLYPIIAHFERLLRFERDEPPEDRLERLHELVIRRLGRPDRDGHLLARLFALPAEGRYGPLPGMSPQKLKDETIRALADLAMAASREAPVLFLFEDAHWADPTSLDALAAVVGRLAQMRVLMVFTHRPEFHAAWSDQPEVVSLTLGRLDAADVRAVVTRVAGGRPLPEPLVEQIVARTDGVPLFVEELTKAILESGAVRDTAEGWVVGGALQEPAIPSTLRDSLMVRLDRLAPTKETAQIGACIGREFSYELLSRVSPLPPDELERTLGTLVGSELMFRRGQGADAVYVFKHALVQDAAYDSLLKSRRAQLHARIAEVLEQSFPEVPATNPEVLARHCQRAGLMPQAATAWTRAAKLAFSRFALPEAVAHGDKALEAAAAIDDPATRAIKELEARAQHGMTWMALGGWFNPNVETALKPAWALASAQGRYDLYVPILWGLSMHALTEGRTGESLAWVRELLDGVKLTGDEDLRMVAHMAAVVCYFWHGDLLEAKRHGDAIEARYDRLRHGHIVGLTNHDPLTITGIYASHWLWILGYPVQALQTCEAKDAHALRVGHWFDIGFTQTLGQWVHEYLEDIPRLDRGLAGAVQLGIDQGLPFFTHLQGPYCQILLAPHREDPQPAIAAADSVLALQDSLGGRIAAPFLRSRLALAHAVAGDLAAAIAEIDHCLAQIERPGWEEESHYAEVLRVSADLRERLGELEQAEALYRQSLAVARSQSARGWELRTATSYARFLERGGRQAEALATLQPVYAWFTEGLDTHDLKQARAVLDRLEPHRSAAS